jgi:hypothetical protein
MRHHAAGDVYALPARMLHSTHVASNAHAVTLMLTGAPESKNPILVGPPGQPPLPYTRPPVSPERHALVRRLVANIEEVSL